MDRGRIFKGIPQSIRVHCERHAEICEIIAEKMCIEESQMKILEFAALAHDIGGILKEEYKEEQKALLRREFQQMSSCNLSSKPSFNPKVCIEHAEERIKLGLRMGISEEERNDPFPLYLEEFEMLKGERLSPKEVELLETWWYHPQYSVDMLEERKIDVSPESEILIRCNEQPWLLKKNKRVMECLEKSELEFDDIERLLAIVRAADIIENGNNRERRNLRDVDVEDFKTTIEFIEHKFKIDGLEKHSDVIDAIKELVSEGDKNFLNVILKCRGELISLGDNFKHGEIEGIIENSFDRLRRSPNKILRNGYESKDEYEVLYDNLWYKFSFVPERRGDFDTFLKLEDVIPEEFDEMDVPHRTPKNRACPFCKPNIDEVLGRIKFNSGNTYTFLANIAPYATNHMVMSAKEETPQMLSEEWIFDLLQASYALGDNYEGSFTSFSGASMKHWHGQFYKVKTPVWRNLKEGRTEIVNSRTEDGVVTGELSHWPARTIVIKGTDVRKVAESVWRETLQLMREGIPYNTKFMYCEDGNYVWMVSPRTHGFMTYVEYFLEDENAVEPEYVSGCGSIESPGGDVIMFFEIPELPQKKMELMAKRFAKTLRETSDWSAAGVYSKGSLMNTLKDSVNERRMAHRVESIDSAECVIKDGYDMIEVDVQLTKDNIAVALWGNVEENGEVYLCGNLTYKELCERANREIMKIEELCQHVRGRAAFNFDIKDWCDSIEGYKESVIDNLINLTESYNLQNNAVFEAFNTEYTDELRNKAEKRGIDIITGAAIHPNLSEDEIVKSVKELSTKGYSTVFIYGEKITTRILDECRNVGIEVFTSYNGVKEAFIKDIKFVVIDI